MVCNFRIGKLSEMVIFEELAEAVEVELPAQPKQQKTSVAKDKSEGASVQCSCANGKH